MILNKKINQKALYEFVNKFKELGYLQQMGIIHKDELILKFAVKPYELTDVKQLFSISKTFTSMAIGLAIAEGKMGLHDKVVDYFRPLIEGEVNPKLAKMEVYHLLTMTTGHDSCVMGKIGPTPNPIKAFLELPLQYEPGTYFAYNTGASLILAVIIKMVTGKELDDYLAPMLEALEIKNSYFEKIDGNCLGGVGTHVDIQALLNFGSMLLHNGEFKGKQVVPADYVKLATSKCVENPHNGTPDWTSGYGLHLWMGQEGYRCDGAYGQLIIVLPDRDIVVAVQAKVDNMQKEVDLVMELVNQLFESCEVLDLENKINDVYKIEKTRDFKQELSLNLAYNGLNLAEIFIRGNGDSIVLEFLGKDSFKIEAGNGYYIKNSFWATGVKAKISGMMPFMYEESVCSCHYIYENDILEVFMKNHNTPLPQSIIIDFNEEIVSINGFNITYEENIE